MRTSTLALFALCSATGISGGCGGGGGGGGGGPSIPGTLAALAVEGAVAPGTGGGTYGAFGTSVPASVAAGGWTAFVADVVGGSTAQGLFAAEPNGTVVLVYGRGDVLPDSTPGTGTITGFGRIFVTSGGVVAAEVQGTSPAAGIVTARVSVSSGVLEKHGAIYTGATLPSTPGGGVPGTLSAIDPELVAVDDQGSVFFKGMGSGGTPVQGIYTMDRTGAGLTAVVASGDLIATGGHVGFTFTGIGIDADGTLVAYAVNVVGGPITKGVFVTNGVATSTVAGNGDTPPNVGSRTFLDVYAGGPLLVSLGGGLGFVTWGGRLSGGSPDLGVFSRQVSPSLGASLETILGPGDSAETPAGTGAQFADVTLVSSQQDPNRVTIDALVSGGTTDQIFYSSAGAGTPFLEILRQGAAAPGGGLFENTYPSLATPHTVAADVLGSPAFTATLSDGSTGVFWAVISNGFFSVAKEGASAPGTGGGTFAPFGSPAVVTTATNVVVFRAAVVGGTAASGIFRQG